MVSNLAWINELTLQTLSKDPGYAGEIPVPVLPSQGQQIWVYNNEKDEVREPVLLSMIRLVQKGKTEDLQKWGKLQMIVSDYTGFWTRLGITYTRILFRTENRICSVKVIRFRSTFLILLKAG